MMFYIKDSLIYIQSMADYLEGLNQLNGNKACRFCSNILIVFLYPVYKQYTK